MKTTLAAALALALGLSIALPVLFHGGKHAPRGQATPSAAAAIQPARSAGAEQGCEEPRTDKGPHPSTPRVAVEAASVPPALNASPSGLTEPSGLTVPSRLTELTSSADASYQAESWLAAGDAYMELLALAPDHPRAEELLDRALEAYSWEDSPRELAVQEEILRRFPARRTPRERFELAILYGTHGEPHDALRMGREVLEDLSADEFKVHALRQMAGFCRLGSDVSNERFYLEQARLLAELLGRTAEAREVERSLAIINEKD